MTCFEILSDEIKCEMIFPTLLMRGIALSLLALGTRATKQDLLPLMNYQLAVSEKVNPQWMVAAKVHSSQRRNLFAELLVQATFCDTEALVGIVRSERQGGSTCSNSGACGHLLRGPYDTVL